MQGKSLAQYLKELQSEVELFFEQDTDLRDRALFICMYHFGLRASEAGLLLREHVTFRTRRIYRARVSLCGVYVKVLWQSGKDPNACSPLHLIALQVFAVLVPAASLPALPVLILSLLAELGRSHEEGCL